MMTANAPMAHPDPCRLAGGHGPELWANSSSEPPMTRNDLPLQTCHRVIYTGRVQGVGFRWTTRSIARRFPVTGTVRNLPDGTVELVAQGPATAVADFLAAVAERMGEQIHGTESARITPPEAFTRFEIRHA
ncbi:MAG: acylphosphatase [Planctomycetaceae bacterium]